MLDISHDDAAYELNAAIEYNPNGKDFSDIESILAVHEGARDEDDWAWLVQFNDGTKGMYLGGCDYTGWDCRSSLQLLPFDGWQQRLVREWSASSMAESVVAELAEQLSGGITEAAEA